MFPMNTALAKSMLGLLSKAAPALAKSAGPNTSAALTKILSLFESGTVEKVAASVGSASSGSTGTATLTEASVKAKNAMPDFRSLFNSLKELKEHIPAEHHDGLSEIFAAAENGEIKLEDSQLEQIKKYFLDLQTNPPTSSSSSTKTYTQEELNAGIEKGVKEKLQQQVAENHEAGTENLEPVEKIITGIGGIVTGEFQNMNSEVGWLMKAVCKWKGITINEKVVGNYLRRFANGGFKHNLERFIKAKVNGHADPLSVCEDLSENDKTAIGWAGTLITVGGSTPSWVFDGVAMLGTIIDYGAEFMHGIPVLGKLLKLPMGRKLITGVGQFAGRFAKDIKLIGMGAKELKEAGGAATSIVPALVPAGN